MLLQVFDVKKIKEAVLKCDPSCRTCIRAMAPGSVAYSTSVCCTSYELRDAVSRSVSATDASSSLRFSRHLSLYPEFSGALTMRSYACLQSSTEAPCTTYARAKLRKRSYVEQKEHEAVPWVPAVNRTGLQGAEWLCCRHLRPDY